MLFFLFSGVQNSGKTTAVKNIYDYLIGNGYVVTHAITPIIPMVTPLTLPVPDFSGILSNGTRTVIVHSACDTPEIIDRLIKLYNENKNVDTIISSIRAPISSVPGNPFDPRTYFLDNLHPYFPGNFCIELPLGRINGNRAHCVTELIWHHSTIATTAQHIVTNLPFNL